VRWLLVVALLAAVAAYALEIEHFIYSGDSKLAEYLEGAYSFYVGKGLKPAPPCQGRSIRCMSTRPAPMLVALKSATDA
jgi:hypothetical protein